MTDSAKPGEHGGDRRDDGGHSPRGGDAQLLARLNALKPSSVQLEKRRYLRKNLPRDDLPSGGEAPLDLTGRLAGLRIASSPPSHVYARKETQHEHRSVGQIGHDGDEEIEALLSQLQESSGVADGSANAQKRHASPRGSEEVIEALEDGDEGADEPDLTFRPADYRKNIRQLLRDARHCVRQSARLQAEVDSPNHQLPRFRDAMAAAQRPTVQQGGEKVPAAADTEEEEDEQRADEYLQQVLDELQVEGESQGVHDKTVESVDAVRPEEASPSSLQPPILGVSTSTGSGRPTDSDDIAAPDDDRPDLPAFDLPSAPTSSLLHPQSETASEAASAEADNLDLPPAPTTAPIVQPSRHRNAFDPSPPPPVSWCCICSGDATIRCLDCAAESNLFCLRCWIEYHLTEGGEEQRAHRRETYVRPSSSQLQR
ncbi:hypothetical protein KEM52_005765 [Ascosphaera acerosa]|nr:hypothetical protein KEM52_005765 [Ascosphaera acerosa]